MTRSGSVGDGLLATGPFGDGSRLLRDLETWLLGLTVADSCSNVPQLRRAGLETASSSELRCVFENWPPRGEPGNGPPFDCVDVSFGTETLVKCGVATASEARAVRDAYADTELGDFDPKAVTDADVGAVRRAVTLLSSALPGVCRNTIGLAPRVIKIPDIVPSMHLSRSPGFAYLSARVMEGETWILADALLHETLHEKSNLLRKFRGLLRGTYREETSHSTFLPWSVDYGEERHFSTWRLLSAGHVYVHLAVFRHAMGLDEPASVPYDRARFMLHALESGPHREVLDTDGYQLVTLLNLALDTISEEKAA